MRNGVGDLLAKRAFVDPNLEAVVDVPSGRRITYAELDRQVNRVAHALQRLGMKKGDRVALLMMNSPAFIETYLGAARVGAVVLPLNWRLTGDELSYVLDDSGAVALVFGDEFSLAVSELHDRGRAIRHWLHVGGDANRPAFASGWEEAVAAGATSAADADVVEDDLLYLMYTSGTTGRPKGVMHTHGSTFWALLNMTASMDYRHGDRYLNCMPLFHVGSLQPANVCIYRGLTTLLMGAFDAAQVWDVIARERATNIMAVPSMLAMMADAYDPSRHDHTSLRWAITAGSPVPVSLLQRYVAMHVEIHQGYGLTECGGPATVLNGADAVAHLGSTGKAFFHCDVRIVGPDDVELPRGETGEVVVRSAANMVGYWNQPDASAQALRGGWLHTGDMADMDAAGYVVIRDRLTDMIISGGENIYPAELEDVIIEHPGVREVAVIAQPSARWGESPCAVIVPARPDLEPADILAWCQGKLARFKLPQAIEFVDEIPRNASGKPLKRILRERFPGVAPNDRSPS